MIHRSEHTRENSSRISRKFIEDDRLSYRAIGLGCYLLTLRGDWKITVRELKELSADGATAIRTALKELADCGYLTKFSSYGVKFSDLSGELRASLRPDDLAQALGEQRTNALPGYVYLINIEDTDIYKIGYSQDPVARLPQIQRDISRPLTLTCACKVDDAPRAEEYWHQHFAGKRVEGEWFELSGEDRRKFILAEGRAQ